MGIQEIGADPLQYSFAWAVKTNKLVDQASVELQGKPYAFNAETFMGANGLVAGIAAIVAASIMMQWVILAKETLWKKLRT